LLTNTNTSEIFMTTSISETKCGDVGLQREEHNQESKGWFQEDQMKRSMNSKPANKFKQCAKVGDELEMLLKGKEIFFDQANHKAWRRGRTAGSPFFGNGTGTNNNEKETEYGGARKKLHAPHVFTPGRRWEAAGNQEATNRSSENQILP